MNFNYFNTYSLFIAISFLKCNDVFYVNNLKGGKLIGIIMFLALTYVFNIVSILKIVMIIVNKL